MNIINREAYELDFNANKDSDYGSAVLRYAEKWADAMETAMANGETLEQCAERTSHEADEGITGFMYGCAVSHLFHCWEHGERLRRWHNHDVQIGDEGDRANESGGVLNPALMSIG